MKSQIRGLALALSVCLLSACGTSMAPMMPMPPMEPPHLDSITFQVVTPAVSNVEENAVLSVGANISPGSSIVIDVPTDFRAFGQNGSRVTDFSTRNYFNFAEQAIERQLIRNGFVVKDRSKFEAILRDLRSQDAGNNFRSNFDPAIQPLLRDLEEDLERGEITDEEYASRVRELRNRFQIFQPSGQRSENEMVDTSEVIRAASASEIKAGYILQISGFETQSIREESIYLLSDPQFRGFLDRYPEARQEFSREEKSYFSCDVLQASLDAKLIEVETGNVAWIGSHTVTELDTAGNTANITLEVRYERRCSNCELIRQQVDFANTEDARIERARSKRDPVIDTPIYATVVFGPTKTGGAQCSHENRLEPELERARRQLASRVARELVRTIRFSSTAGA